ALELAQRERGRVALDAALGAAVGHVDERRLPGNQAGEGANLVQIDVGVVAQAALEGAAGVVVLDAVAAEVADGTIIHLDDELHFELPFGGDQEFSISLGQAQQVESALYEQVGRLGGVIHRRRAPRFRVGSETGSDFVAKACKSAASFASGKLDVASDGVAKRTSELKDEWVGPVTRPIDARPNHAFGIDEPLFVKELRSDVIGDDTRLRVDEHLDGQFSTEQR